MQWNKMIQHLPTKELLKAIGKDARSYVIFIFAGLIWYFVFRFTGAINQVNENCEREKAQLRQEIIIVRQQYNDLIISDRERSDSMQREMARQLDNLLHDRLEIKTKANLQNGK